MIKAFSIAMVNELENGGATVLQFDVFFRGRQMKSVAAIPSPGGIDFQNCLPPDVVKAAGVGGTHLSEQQIAGQIWPYFIPLFPIDQVDR
ncbi:MAG: hypothetical protein KJ755_18290 [Alphaproteobacteria bacterium]|nr:hypothetical protein [Alphaproteobacteria bacterium]